MELKYEDVIDDNGKSWTKIQSNWFYSDGDCITLWFDPEYDNVSDLSQTIISHNSKYEEDDAPGVEDIVWMFQDIWIEGLEIGINITSPKQLDKKAKQLIKVLWLIDQLINKGGLK